MTIVARSAFPTTVPTQWLGCQEDNRRVAFPALRASTGEVSPRAECVFEFHGHQAYYHYTSDETDCLQVHLRFLPLSSTAEEAPRMHFAGARIAARRAELLEVSGASQTSGKAGAKFKIARDPAAGSGGLG